METKFGTRRSSSGAPGFEVPSNDRVAKETETFRMESGAPLLNERGKDDEKTDERSSEAKVRVVASNALPQRRRAVVKRRTNSFNSARFKAYNAARRGSIARRNYFLRSFGKTEIMYPNLCEDDLHLEEVRAMENGISKPVVNYTEPASETLVNDSCLRLPTASTELSCGLSSNTTAVYENLLALRGSQYTGVCSKVDVTARIREQSAKRRIRRIIEAEKEKTEKAQMAQEQREKDLEKKKRFTLRGTTFAVMAMTVSAAGFNFNSFTEKKRWLAEKRSWTRQIVRSTI